MPVSNVNLQVLGADDVLAGLRALRARQPVKFSAFYSSQLGGIVTDPALMVIPFDDHMVHRGHGIFDTAGLVNGRIYDLEAHLDRFLGSAERSKLTLAGLARRDARHHRQDHRGQRPARWRDPILAVVRTGQPRVESGRRRAARLLRDDLWRPVVPGALVHRRSPGDDDDLSDQAAAVRDHQGDELPAECPDADGSEGGGAATTASSSTRGLRRRELQHERRVRHARRRVAASQSSSTCLAGCTSLRLLELARSLVGEAC